MWACGERCQRGKHALCEKHRKCEGPCLANPHPCSFSSILPASKAHLSFISPTPQGLRLALTEVTSSQLSFITFSLIITFLKAGAESDVLSPPTAPSPAYSEEKALRVLRVVARGLRNRQSSAACEHPPNHAARSQLGPDAVHTRGSPATSLWTHLCLVTVGRGAGVSRSQRVLSLDVKNQWLLKLVCEERPSFACSAVACPSEHGARLKGSGVALEQVPSRAGQEPHRGPSISCKRLSRGPCDMEAACRTPSAFYFFQLSTASHLPPPPSLTAA